MSDTFAMPGPLHSSNGITPPEGEHRFLVSSAEEAVRAIRLRLGEGAEVTSVRRVERGGLTGLFRAPQLEVIAHAPPRPTPRQTRQENAPPSTPLEDPVRTTYSYGSALSTSASSSPVQALPSPIVPPVSALLRRSGFGELLLARLQGVAGWDSLHQLDLPNALEKAASLLRADHARVAAPDPLPNRLAFLGMAGSGGTTMLCKHLVKNVFRLGKEAAVFRLPRGQPGRADELETLCELWGVRLLRSEQEVASLGTNVLLYVDVPGFASGTDRSEEADIASWLNRFDVHGRIFVLNAAYDAEILKKFCNCAERLGCRHIAFSHLDELVHWGKLWDFLLHRTLRTEFLSSGPDHSDEFTTDVMEQTLAKTFS